LLNLPEQISVDRIKKVIGQLIADKKLEYVDYRCYRIYTRFEDYLEACDSIDDRSREVLRRRLMGETLEQIGIALEITRERVRQIAKKGSEALRNSYSAATGMLYFDEDYYSHLISTYELDRRDGEIWLGIPSSVWNYLELFGIKRGTKDLNEALMDIEGLEAGMRLKIKNYLNRNKLFVDGVWVEKKRADLESVVVRKFCQENVSFDDFCEIYNVPHNMIDVEITESAFSDNTGLIKNAVTKIRDAGYEIWIDDFGNGYSSLTTLADYDFDVLKLDMVFLRSIDHNPKTRTLMNFIIKTTNSMGYSPLCEGVETEEHYKFLKEVGCDRAQGYYFGKPMPLDELLDYLYDKGFKWEENS
jgi:hypothetical protein